MPTLFRLSRSLSSTADLITIVLLQREPNLAHMKNEEETKDSKILDSKAASALRTCDKVTKTISNN